MHFWHKRQSAKILQLKPDGDTLVKMKKLLLPCSLLLILWSGYALAVLDINDPQAVQEAIIKMHNGEISYPDHAESDLGTTGFSCAKRSAGTYADRKLGCQGYHVCDGKSDRPASSSLCDAGKVYSEYYATCLLAPAVECPAP